MTKVPRDFHISLSLLPSLTNLSNRKSIHLFQFILLCLFLYFSYNERKLVNYAITAGSSIV